MIIAATGHRPEKLGGYSPVVLSRLTDLATAYFSRTFPTKIISGMALGWDTAVAIAAINLNIPLIAAVPFKGQESRWQSCDQQRYREILTYAVDIVIVSPGSYTSAKMQVRNKYMVDNCVGASLVVDIAYLHFMMVLLVVPPIVLIMLNPGMLKLLMFGNPGSSIVVFDF